MPRKRSASLPAHIDPAKLPAGVYWQATGLGRWYTLERDSETGRQRYRRIAGPDARLSDLYAIVEDRAQAGTVARVIEAFHASREFAGLAARTRTDYRRYATAINAQHTRLGGTFGTLAVDRLSPPVIRRWIDSIAGTYPTKANHWLRYLKRVFQWGLQYGECRTNPARAVRQVKERGEHHMPDLLTFRRVQAFARERGARSGRRSGAVAPYLWAAMEIAYACRLRGIEVRTLTDANVLDAGLRTNRHKGSRDTIVAWAPSLRAAVDALQSRRVSVWQARAMSVPMTPTGRPLLVSERGDAVGRDTFANAWQRMMRQAIAVGIITPKQRFGLHGLKHRGVTDTPGTDADKKQASGHRTDVMVDRYDHAIPIVNVPRGGG